MMTLPEFDVPQIEGDAKIIHNYKLQLETGLRLFATENAHEPFEVAPFLCAERLYVEHALTGKMLAMVYPQRVSPERIKYLGAEGDWLNLFLLKHDRVINAVMVQS